MGAAAEPLRFTPRPAVATPWWIVAGCLAIVGWIVLHSFSPEAGGFPLQAAAAVLKLAVEGGAMLWGAGRADLPRRARLSLRLFGGTALTSAAIALVLTVGFATGVRIIPRGVQVGWNLLSYLLAVAGLLVWPTVVWRGRALRTLLLDLCITVGGIGMLMWTLLTQPLAAAQPVALTARTVTSYGLSTIGLMTGLTVLILRGRIIPSARAFWWFVAGQGLYLPVALLSQTDNASLTDERGTDALYAFSAVVIAIAMRYLRQDPSEGDGMRRRASWASELNPLALVTPAAIGIFLLLALEHGSAAQVRHLAIALAGVSSLLALRLLLTSRENVILLEEEARAARERHREVTRAVGQLAAGIAHWFNNLLTTVVARAEIGELESGRNAAAAEDFREIRKAGTQAATLTRQLLEYSAGSPRHREPVDLADRVRHCLASVELHGREDISIEQELLVRCMVLADAQQLDQLIAELLRNAVDVTPIGGTVRIALTQQRLRVPLESPYLRAEAGPVAVLAVQDSGPGIPAEDLPRIFDPFFTRKPMFRAAGLGLSAVHGIVSAHHGGITVDTESGRGTEMRIYLPLSAEGTAA